MANRAGIETRLAELVADFEVAYEQLQIEAKAQELAELEDQLNQPSIWNDPTKAQALAKTVASKQEFLQPWQAMKLQLADYRELLTIDDETWLEEVERQIEALAEQLTELKRALAFNGKHDASDVILRLTSGVGGLDAQDFTERLERMYLRWLKNQQFTVNLIERQTSDEAGIKTAVYEVSGPFAYGKLKSEHGVHRLVRLSPFNADNLRQTSFALVEVLPKIEADELKIAESDLKIDYYRSGGHGGQSVNTTDSAVRVTHIPTGLTVAIQNERSQIQNKAVALAILTAKLAEMQEQQQAEDLSQLKAGESASWGAQIRNYVLHPYTLVKDTRTKYQETDVAKVLDGKIDGFIEAYLDSLLASKN